MPSPGTLPEKYAGGVVPAGTQTRLITTAPALKRSAIFADNESIVRYCCQQSHWLIGIPGRKFLLAISPSVGTLLVHEAPNAPVSRRVLARLLRIARRRTGTAAARSNGKGDSQRFDQHSNTRRTFCRARKTG